MTETAERSPQVRFPGQAATPPGPADLTITLLMHHGFRRDLRDFARAAPQTPVEDRAAWRALATRWELFRLALHQHQHEEDTYLWPFLRARVAPEQHPTLEAMEAEHTELQRTLESCSAGFARMVECADSDARAALGVRLVSAREGLDSHLAHEETDGFALVQRWVSGPEWAQLQQLFVRGLSLGFWLQVIPWSMHEVPAACRAEVLRRAPVAQRVLWWVTRRRFARLDRAAFAHLP